MGERSTFLDGLGSAGIGTAANFITEGLDSIFGITERREKRQIEQQQKLTDQQVNAAIRLAGVNKENAMDVWNRTAAPEQLKKIKEAGLNPALMYGGSGEGGGMVGGGTVAIPEGGKADGAAATGATQMGMAMMGAQLELIKAQTKKTEVEAAKTAGVDTESATQSIGESKSRQSLLEFQNAVNAAVGNISEAEARRADNSIRGIQMEKQNLEWETFKKEGWKSGSVEDSNNLANKAVKAGLMQTIQTLENAKKAGNILDATTTIEQFKAGLAREGISPDSPWYIKIVGDLLEKVGLSPIRAVKDTIK